MFTGTLKCEGHMDTKTAARIFYDWANREGFLVAPLTSTLASTPQEIGQIMPKSAAGTQILRAKQVHAVASNEPLRRVIVFTHRATPKSKKQIAMLPTHIDDIEIVYRQGAPSPVGTLSTSPQGSPTFVVHQTASGHHYTCGSSISVGNHRDAGTLGCLVRDAGGTLFGLTNNHVSASCNFAGVGLPILAPGVWDVVPNGLPPFTIGFHAKGLTLVTGTPDNVNWQKNTDAAIFRINRPSDVSSYQGDKYDTPSKVGTFVGNQAVEKVGRTTGHTMGRVIGQLHGSIPVPYSMQIYGFSGQVFFEPVYSIAGTGMPFSDHGDSGALITALDEDGTRMAVGLVFGSMTDASAPGGKVTLALPILPILEELSVTLVNGHNV